MSYSLKSGIRALDTAPEGIGFSDKVVHVLPEYWFYPGHEESRGTKNTLKRFVSQSTMNK